MDRLRASQLAAAVVAIATLGACGPPAPTPTPSPLSSPTSSPISGTQGTPPPTDTSPTAAVLIQQDLAAGKITEDQALEYRLQAMFGDARTPGQYASAPAGEDLAALAIAADELAGTDVTAAVRAELAPFVARPDDPVSIFHGSGTGAATANQQALLLADATPTCGSRSWESLSSVTQPIKVWAPCGRSAEGVGLNQVLSAAETFYAQESALMGPAIFDNGAPTDNGYLAGGDTRIDLYVTDDCVTPGGSRCVVPDRPWRAFALPAEPIVQRPASKSSGFAVIRPSVTNSLASLRSVVAHEIFHILQFAHNLGGLIEGREAHWFVEASATWAEEHFVPEGRPTEVYPFFGNFQQSLVGLNTVDHTNEYASFAWPYFMEQKRGVQAIAQAWRALEGKTGWTNADAALNSAFSFADNYKDFAVQALNAKLVPGDPLAPEFQEPDASFPGYGVSSSFNLREPVKEWLVGPLGGSYDVSIDVAVPALAMRYFLVSIGEDVSKLVIDMSKIQPAAALDAEAIVRLRDGTWKREPMSDGTTTWCLDRPEENVTVVLLVLANHSWQAADKLTGAWTTKAQKDLCAKTSYTIDLAGPLKGAGHYEGSGEIECWHLADGSYMGGGFFVPEQPPILDFTFGGDAMDVAVRDAPPEEGGLWFVNPAVGGTAKTVAVAGSNPVQVVVTGSRPNVQMTIHATCSIVHEP